MNKRTIVAIVLAYLVPGAGHFYLGRRARAVAFFCIVMLLFILGLAINGRVYSVEPGNVLTLLATIGSLGIGIPYFVAHHIGAYGDVTSITYEHGTSFVLTAGLMNLLLILDAFDIAEGRKE